MVRVQVLLVQDAHLGDEVLPVLVDQGIVNGCLILQRYHFPVPVSPHAGLHSRVSPNATIKSIDNSQAVIAGECKELCTGAVQHRVTVHSTP